MISRIDRRIRILMGATLPETVTAFMLDQAAFLVSEGFEVHIFCNAANTVASEESRRVGIKFHDISMARTINPVRDISSVYQLVKLIRKTRPDIVLVGTPKAGLLGILASSLARVPRRIYLVRGIRLEGLLGIQYYMSAITEKVACGLATEVLCVSKSVKQRFEELRLSKAKKLIVLGMGGSNGVNTDYFRPPTDQERNEARRNLGIYDQRPLVGFVGRLTEDKGVSDLFNAVLEVRNSFDTAELILVGGLDQVSPLLVLDEEDSAKHWCQKVGKVEDVRTYYWAMDIFCLPSLREGLPNANLEAAACGLPVVSTWATGCKDSVIDGLTGRLVTPGSFTELSDTILELIMDKHGRRIMGAAGRKFMSESFLQSVVWKALSDHLKNPQRN